MKYIKKINEDFNNEFSGSDASAILMDYDTFKINGTNPNSDEEKTTDKDSVENIIEPDQIDDSEGKSSRKQVG